MTIKVASDKLAGRLNVTEFSETILFKALSRVPKLSEKGPWIAGGAVRRTIEGKKLESDFDFFFANKEQEDQFAYDLVEMGAKLLKKNDKNSLYILSSSIPDDTEGEGVYLPEMKIQLINFTYFETAEAVIDSFDFTLCQFAYDGNMVYMSDFALWDVARKKLVPHKISYATSSLRRLMKYANQGFTVCGGALSQILQQVVDNPSVIQADTLYID
jgi:hypothetical protein